MGLKTGSLWASESDTHRKDCDDLLTMRHVVRGQPQLASIWLPSHCQATGHLHLVWASSEAERKLKKGFDSDPHGSASPQK